MSRAGVTNGRGRISTESEAAVVAPGLCKGALVLVVPLGQHAIVRRRRRDRFQVHFGFANNREYLAWYSWRDLRLAPRVEP